MPNMRLKEILTKCECNVYFENSLTLGGGAAQSKIVIVEMDVCELYKYMSFKIVSGFCSSVMLPVYGYRPTYN